ncbi:AI-2E family transporter [Undibacterium sp. Jales W-56]|uniref:AI-2E family transporter n=1 Tax=Undibacterium sp. Jales W-56 TaxID=2897325 RepID=UPI0021CE212A|nr:AI-2E family transporter [Undibacterium sp. Jales W-56]MCU6434578.1 AI-2E family transporter [Undibacterium sp. Jales W-56]
MPFSFTAEQKQTALWLLMGCALLLLMSMLGPILMPFIVAAILAYILNPWVDRLCALRIKRFQLPRALAATLLILLVIMLILTMLLIMTPILQKQIPQLQDQIPRFLDKANDLLGPMLNDLGVKVKLDSAGIKSMLSEQLATSGDVIGKAVLSSIRVGGTAVIGMVANLLLIPIVLFYLLMDWHALMDRLEHFIPRRWVGGVKSGVIEVDSILAQYLRGQIMVMIVLAIYYAGGLALAGFDLALPVGIITGFLVFIPYLGFGLGLVLALIGAVLQFDGMHGLVAVAIVYGIGQVLEGFFLTPRLVGERIGLHPLTVIFALMAFGQLFGFIGILVALPASAILAVAVKHLRTSYFNSSLYRQP